MIELYIDNKEVYLPSDISFTLVDENPIISKNGEFSLDITLSLLHPVNVKSFSFINRLNNTNIIPTSPARLIVDGMTRTGKVIVNHHTESEVIVQFVSGNSEFNYTLKNDKRKIWSLDWGEETSINFDKALVSINNNTGYGPTPTGFRKYVCAPIQIKVDNANVIYNNYRAVNKVAEVCLCYTGNLLTSDIYNVEYYTNLTKEVVAAGAHIIG